MSSARHSFHVDRRVTTLEILGGKDCFEGSAASTRPDLTVLGGTQVGKTLCVDGQIIAQSDLNARGNLSVMGMTFLDDVEAENVTANCLTAAKLAMGNVDIAGNSTIQGMQTICGALMVKGDSTLQTVITDDITTGDITADDISANTLSVEEDGVVCGDLTVKGNLFAAITNMTGNCLTSSDLSSEVCVNSGGTVDITGDTCVDGNLKVTNNLEVQGTITGTDLDVSGKITTDDLCANTANIMGNLEVSSGGDIVVTTGSMLLNGGSLSAFGGGFFGGGGSFGGAVTFPGGSVIGTDDSGDMCVEGNLKVVGQILANIESGITVEDEGSPLTTPATTLNFVGPGVSASGTGSTKTITVVASTHAGPFADSTFVGAGSSVTAAQGTVVGANSTAGNFSTVIGEGASGTLGRSVVVGQGAVSTAAFGTAVGERSQCNGADGAAFGARADANAGRATAIGAASVANTGGTAVGTSADAIGTNSIAIGDSTNASQVGAVAIGGPADVQAQQAIGIGTRQAGFGVRGEFSVGIGYFSRIDATGDNGVGIGRESTVTQDSGIAIGRNATSSAARAVALGQGIVANQTDGVFMRHRAPGATTGQIAAFVAGTNELIELNLTPDDFLTVNGGELDLDCADIGNVMNLTVESMESKSGGNITINSSVDINPSETLYVSTISGHSPVVIDAPVIMNSTLTLQTLGAVDGNLVATDTVIANALVVNGDVDVSGEMCIDGAIKAQQLGLTVRDEGSLLNTALETREINFTGASVTVTSTGTNSVQVDIPALTPIVMDDGTVTGDRYPTDPSVQGVWYGTNAKGQTDNFSVVIGNNPLNTGNRNVLVGTQAEVRGSQNVIVGFDRRSGDAVGGVNQSVCIGYLPGTYDRGTGHVIIGHSARMQQNGSSGATLIGRDTIGASGCVAVGDGAIAQSVSGICIGQGAVNGGFGGTHNISIGVGADSKNWQHNMAIGTGAQCGNGTVSNGIAIGRLSNCSGSSQGICIGFSSSVTSATGGMALGRSASCTGEFATAVGRSASVTGDRAVAVGFSASAVASAIAIGDDPTASATSSIAIGDGAVASAAGATALGQGVNNNIGSTVLLGTNSDNLVRFEVPGTIAQTPGAANLNMGVTLNNAQGKITLADAVGPATATTATFTVTNSRVQASSVIQLTVEADQACVATLTSVGAGSFGVRLENSTGVDTTAPPVIHYNVYYPV